MTGFDARASVQTGAPPAAVWEMLTTRASEVWLGSTVTSDWQPGSTITWAGEWEGRSFEDHGEVVTARFPSRLVFTHLSHGTGAEDAHRIDITLSPVAGGTRVELMQDNNPSQDAADHSSATMQRVLDAAKAGAEG